MGAAAAGAWGLDGWPVGVWPVGVWATARAETENAQAAAAHAATLGAEALFLEAGTENPAALALYARLGFARVGARKGYYDNPSQAQAGHGDALVLKAALPLPGDLP